ncbi:MAG: hypothetical protein WCS42_19620 [Verrucomicrobiota bacterium]
MDGTEEFIVSQMGKMLAEVSGAAGLCFVATPPTPEVLVLKCGVGPAMDMLRSNPPHWLHSKMETVKRDEK